MVRLAQAASGRSWETDAGLAVVGKALQFSLGAQGLSSVSLALCGFAGVCSLRVVDLVEHQLARDGRLGAVYGGGAALERRHHLLHHLVEEDVGELRVDEGAELEGDLWGRGGGRSFTGVCATAGDAEDVSADGGVPLPWLLTAKSTVQVLG